MKVINPLTIKWQKVLDELTEELGRWSDARNFSEDLRADEILSLWEKELADGERYFLENFIERWYEAAERQAATQLCSECSNYALLCHLEYKARRQLCGKCGKRLKDGANVKAGRQPNGQISLF